ncbi:MAG: hypothetical protein ACRC36_14230 [Lacrimispora sphenoides]
MEEVKGFKIYVDTYCEQCPYFIPENRQNTVSDKISTGGLRVNNFITCKNKGACRRAVTGKSY